MTIKPFNEISQITDAEKARRKAEAKRYLDSLQFGKIESVTHEHFSGTYNLFAQMFHTDGEPWVSKDQFDKGLNFQNDKAFQDKLGPLAYSMIYAYDPKEGKVVGGATYFSMIPSRDVCEAGNVDAVYLGGYIFTDSNNRGCGLASRLIEERDCNVKTYARSIYAEQGRDVQNPRILGFNEQNDPLLMTPEQILEDIRTTGMTPWDRLIGSRKCTGWQRIDSRFDYIEPHKSSAPFDDYLVFGVKGEGNNAPPREIPASVVKHILRHYAAVRLAGESPDNNQSHRQQVQLLDKIGTLRPINDGHLYESLKPQFEMLAKKAKDGTLPERDMAVRVIDLFERENQQVNARRQTRKVSFTDAYAY